jgi:hypothetical protein
LFSAAPQRTCQELPLTGPGALLVLLGLLLCKGLAGSFIYSAC